ncbi:MAG: endolytic transglycosylase MltG [Faecalibacterium prausnitzii]|nr:endolytic transglycosylase MltG [Faecalibacterium prausnitzii]
MAQKQSHTKPRKKAGAAKVLLILLVVLLLAAGAAVLAARAEIHGKGRASRTVTVTIEKGSGVAAIADRLKQEGVIRSSLLFRYYVKNTDSASRLQYGTFTLDAGWPYVELVDALSQYAKAESVRLTFPEGTTAQAIAQKMEQAGLCTAQEFLDEANNGDFSQYRFWQYVPEQVPGRFMKCEGYLFPDTYDFLMEDTVHNYVATFYAHFDAQITEEMYAALEAQEMSLPQLVTLASFVQEEAGNAQDSNVAQVFRNRLAPSSPYRRLQSNASSYIQNDADNNYLWNWVAPYYGGWDKIPPEILAAYDTYALEGLPAGPISNPGLAAIQASLSPQPDPEVKDCYFFVTDLAGTYYYGRTMSEHNANCDKAAAVNKSLRAAAGK